MTTNDARDLTGEEIAQFKAHAESYPQTSSAWMFRVLAKLERTQAALAIYREVAEEAQCHWGDDYLWEKWRMSERMKEASDIMPPVPGKA